jgi:hypothetical protein
MLNNMEETERQEKWEEEKECWESLRKMEDMLIQGLVNEKFRNHQRKANQAVNGGF